jgi:hypothetical protein
LGERILLAAFPAAVLASFWVAQSVAIVAPPTSLPENRDTWSTRDHEHYVSSPAFARQPAQKQHEELVKAARSELKAERYGQAAAFARQAAASEQAEGDDWYLLLEIAHDAHDDVGQITALTGLAEKFPADTLSLNERSGWRVIRLAMHRPDRAPYFRLLNALFDADWQTDRGEQPSEQWAILARMLIERHDLERAGEVAKRITDPSYLLGIRADRRYAPLIAQLRPAIDAQHVCAVTLSGLAERMRDDPHSLDIVLGVVGTALEVGRPDLALEVLDPVMPRLELDKDAPTGFRDVVGRHARRCAADARGAGGGGRAPGRIRPAPRSAKGGRSADSGRAARCGRRGKGAEGRLETGEAVARGPVTRHAL